jgi:hypothetical protein
MSNFETNFNHRRRDDSTLACIETVERFNVDLLNGRDFVCEGERFLSIYSEPQVQTYRDISKAFLSTRKTSEWGIGFANIDPTKQKTLQDRGLNEAPFRIPRNIRPAEKVHINPEQASKYAYRLGLFFGYLHNYTGDRSLVTTMDNYNLNASDVFGITTFADEKHTKNGNTTFVILPMFGLEKASGGPAKILQKIVNTSKVAQLQPEFFLDGYKVGGEYGQAAK